MKVLDDSSERETPPELWVTVVIPWQELDRGLLNGVFQCYEAQKERHTHTPREV